MEFSGRLTKAPDSAGGRAILSFHLPLPLLPPTSDGRTPQGGESRKTLMGPLITLKCCHHNCTAFIWKSFRGETNFYLVKPFLFPFLFFPFRAAPTAYKSSQTRGQIGAAAASLHHSHSNAGSESNLQPTPKLVAMPDP